MKGKYAYGSIEWKMITNNKFFGGFSYSQVTNVILDNFIKHKPLGISEEWLFSDFFRFKYPDRESERV